MRTLKIFNNLNLPNLKYLDLSSNNIMNCEIISKYTTLEVLKLSRNKILTLKPLKKLTKLRELYVDSN